VFVRRLGGFTLVELVAVTVIASILFVTLSIKFTNNNTQLISAKNDIITALQQARQIALTRTDTDNSVSFILSANLIDLREGSNSVELPGEQYPMALPSGITVTQGTGIYRFDRLGNTREDTIQLSDGNQSQQISISRGGYAY
jgi:MSHA pilin protein MshC